MQITRILAAALLAAGFAAGTARANVCVADHMMCGTTMPEGGYCQCTAHGATEDGTAAKRAPAHGQINATAGGCGAKPNAPGCH